MIKSFVCLGLVVVTISLIFLFSWGKYETSSVADYSIMEEKFNRNANSELKLFPDSLKPTGENVEYNAQLKEGVLDSECQIFLRCTYSEMEYEKKWKELKI